QRERGQWLVQSKIPWQFAHEVVGTPVDIQPLGGTLHQPSIKQPSEEIESREDMFVLLRTSVMVRAQQMLHVLISITVAREHVQQHRVRHAKLRDELLRFSMNDAVKRLFRPNNRTVRSEERRVGKEGQ